MIILGIPQAANVTPQEQVNIILVKVILENLREKFSRATLDIRRFGGLAEGKKKMKLMTRTRCLREQLMDKSVRH